MTRAQFLPDGKRFIFVGAEPGKASRTWVQSLNGGAPTPVTPEGVFGLLATPDGTRVLSSHNAFGCSIRSTAKASRRP